MREVTGRLAATASARAEFTPITDYSKYRYTANAMRNIIT